MTADRDAWLKALGVVVNGSSEATGSVSCPNCGQYGLGIRYVVEAQSRIGYVLFWCGDCLHGITVSRVRAPEGMPTRTFDDPIAVAGVPNFIRHD